MSIKVNNFPIHKEWFEAVKELNDVDDAHAFINKNYHDCLVYFRTSDPKNPGEILKRLLDMQKGVRMLDRAVNDLGNKMAKLTKEKVGSKE